MTMVAVSRETQDRLDAYVMMLLAENRQQNLIAKSTEPDIWQRHIVDSLQLVRHALPGRWVDIGSGAGLPGLVAAIARPEEETVLIEPRARRVAFLTETAMRLGLTKVRVIGARAEAVPELSASVITARAVASLSQLFEIGARHAGPDCLWLLSKGRSAATELAEARGAWQGRFELIPSETDVEASIVMARDVVKAGRAGRGR